MDTVAIQFFTSQLIPWLLFSSVVYGAAAYLTRDCNTSTWVWWLSLLASFLPLLPLSFASVVISAPNVAWINASIENIHVVKQATIAHSGLNDMDYAVSLLIAAYTIVVLYKLVRLSVNWRRLKVVTRQARPIDVDSPANVNVVVSMFNHSPFVYGVFRPTIVLPQYYLSMNSERQRILVQHELTHIAQNDPVAVIVWRVLSVVLWVNPFVNKMEWQFIRAMEHRCDSQTISRYGLSKFEYAQTLLQSLRKGAVVNPSPVAQFNSAALDADDYKQRLTLIVQANQNVKIKVILGLFLTIFSLVGCAGYFGAAIGDDAPTWQHPLKDYRISSPYKSVNKIRYYKPHQGIDYVALNGSQIGAAADGVVVIADAQTLHPNFGNTVIIQHKGGYQTLYAHLAFINVAPGDWVSAGQRIGIIGDTGRTTGVHLHLEVMKHQQRLNPSEVLP